MPYYYETAGINGKWCPQVSAQPPRVKNGREDRLDGMGARMRELGPSGYNVEVPDRHAGRPLDELRRVLFLEPPSEALEVATEALTKIRTAKSLGQSQLDAFHALRRITEISP